MATTDTRPLERAVAVLESLEVKRTAELTKAVEIATAAIKAEIKRALRRPTMTGRNDILTDTERQLRRLFWIDRSIEAKRQQMKRLREIGVSCTSRTDTERFTGGGSDGTKIERSVEGADEILRQIDVELQEMSVIRTQIMQMINRVKDDRLRYLLELRYVNLKPIEEIADIMGYDKRSILRHKAQAITEIEKLSPIVT